MATGIANMENFYNFTSERILTLVTNLSFQPLNLRQPG